MVVNGDLCEEEEAAGDLDSPASVASALSCKQALADEEATAARTLGMDVDGEWRSAVVPVSRGDGEGESEQSGERSRVGEKGVEGSLLRQCVRG
jgi:hypothetical protein